MGWCKLSLMSRLFTRRSILVASFAGIIANPLSKLSWAFGATNLNVILGRPTGNSIAISMMTDTPVAVFIEYGTTGKTFTNKSATLQLSLIHI